MSERMVQITEARFVELLEKEERLTARPHVILDMANDAALGALVRQLPRGYQLGRHVQDDTWEVCAYRQGANPFYDTPEAALRAALETVKP